MHRLIVDEVVVAVLHVHGDPSHLEVEKLTRLWRRPSPADPSAEYGPDPRAVGPFPAEVGGAATVAWWALLKWKEVSRPEFAGKAVVVRCTSGRGGGVLTGVKAVRIGFSNFLVGRRVEAEPQLPGEQPGVISWFNFNMISQMHVFDDVDSAVYWHESDTFGI